MVSLQEAKLLAKEGDLVTRYGIADAHGIESYCRKLPIKRRGGSDVSWMEMCGPPALMQLRVEANRARHAVFYQVTLLPEDDDVVERLLNEEDFAGALDVVKHKAVTIGFPVARHERYEKSWKLIPNPDLDPW